MWTSDRFNKIMETHKNCRFCDHHRVYRRQFLIYAVLFAYQWKRGIAKLNYGFVAILVNERI